MFEMRLGPAAFRLRCGDAATQVTVLLSDALARCRHHARAVR
ncbi:hypothetical protein [Sphingomonas sp.]